MADHFGLEVERQIEKSGVRKVFTPHAPVQIQDLLFGRSGTVQQIVKQINNPGAYPILYGDRGVGKTSIASIVQIVIDHSKNTLINTFKNTYIDGKKCSSQETLGSIFKNVLKKCDVDLDLIESTQSVESGGSADLAAGFAKAGVASKRNRTEKKGAAEKRITASYLAELLSKKFDFGLLIIDEVDAIKDETVKFQLAETIKLLSDSHSTFKIMLVGVAELSESLTAGHPSIGRCAVETKLDRMKDGEIRQIITNGSIRIKPAMDFDSEVVKQIAQLANGYPYFAHLIALKCVEDAICDNRKHIRIHHLPSALKSATLEAEQSLRFAFDSATSSATTNMFRIVVDAASRFGVENFSASDLRGKIKEIHGQDITQGALNNLFKKLVDDNHKRILHRVAKGTYRFSDPRMPSFVKMICESEVHYPNKDKSQ